MTIETTSLSLAGSWGFALDPERRGKKEAWFCRSLADTVTLPGTTDSNGKGTGAEPPNYRNLNRRCAFSGWAWYQREAEIPESFAGKTVSLYLERCLWETFLWVDDTFAGTQDSLAAPHEYDLTGLLTPGRHRLTLLVDNSNLLDGNVPDEDTSARRDLTSGASRRWKHRCGGHHTVFLMPTNWNGVLGRMELRAAPPVGLLRADVFPARDLRRADAVLRVANRQGLRGDAVLRLRIEREEGGELLRETARVSLSGDREQKLSLTLPLPETMTPWNEFHPALYRLSAELSAEGMESSVSAVFGLRHLETRGRQILLNGRPVFLRGTVENCTFPLSFAPPAEPEPWERIFRIAKEYGLNHMRFHTFCPPEAAFAAADRAGFLLQVELPGSSCPDYEEAPEDTAFLQRELERILKAYGNHPSFAMLSMGNEQLVALDSPELIERQQGLLTEKVAFGQREDPRHLYTCTSHPYTRGRRDDYFVSAWTEKGWDAMNTPGAPRDWDCFLTAIQWGGPDPLDTCVYCMRPPTLDCDYDGGLPEEGKPFVSHEVGQWEVFPDVRETEDFSGVLEAGNFRLIREDLREKGMLPLVPEFVRASGKLSLMLYRDEIETMLRSRRLSGFQLLDLTDYPGQGTSTVGILNSRWGSKGLVTPEEFRRFCAPLALLLRTEKRVYTAGETIAARAEAANYTEEDAASGWTWIVSCEGETLAAGGGSRPAAAGGVSSLGEFSFAVPAWEDARRLTVTLALAGTGVRSSWEFWTYPKAEAEAGSRVITRWDAGAAARLLSGERLLLLPESLPDSLPGVFTTVFWNPQMKRQTGTFGLLCDPKEPALEGFPHEGCTGWQWWDVVTQSRVMDLSALPVEPLVRVIDSFMTNRRLGLLFEARVGEGRLLVCSAGLERDLAERPASRWLLRCLLRYLDGSAFEPRASLSVPELDRFFGGA